MSPENPVPKKKQRKKRKHSTKNAFIRKGRHYELNEVLPNVVGKFYRRKYMEFDGDKISLKSTRLNVFKEKGVRCAGCGLEGKFLVKEMSPVNVKRDDCGNQTFSWHFNLYAVNRDGEEVLMTIDHILPRSKQGKTTLENLQPMCFRCNQKKGNRV